MQYRQAFLIFSLALIGTALHSQNIKQWRGLDRSGVFPAENLLQKWPETGPEALMIIDSLPDSYSSVVLHDSILYTTGIVDDDEFLTAISMEGKTLWNVRYGNSWEGSFSNARCTPTIEGKNAWLISGSGELACVDLELGKLRWSSDGYSEFEGKHGTWGSAESPLIIGDKMIYTPCGDKTTMVAVNKHSGETIWQSKSINDQSAYCSPALMKLDAYEFIITVSGNYILCVNSEDGEIFWKYEYSSVDEPSNGADINPVTPVIRNDEIFVTSGYNHVGLMLKMAYNYRSASLKWKTNDLDVHHGGVVYHEGFLYGANYTSIIKGNWLCIDWNTGQVQYDESWHGKGSIIFADEHLICYDERSGHVGLVRATPEKFALVSEFKIDQGRGPHWSHPSIYEGYLLIRHGKTLGVYKVQENSITI